MKANSTKNIIYLFPSVWKTFYLNYDRLVATLQHCDKDDLPLLSDLEIPPSDIQTISEIIDEYHTHLMSPRVPGQDVVGPFFSRGDLFSREA